MNNQVIGQLLVWLTLASNLLVGFAFFRTANGDRSWRQIGHKSYNLFAIFATLTLAWLFYLFFSHDFSFKYVYEYSDTKLNHFLLTAALWAGQEGTYVLWLFMSALFGYLILKKGGQYTNWAMVIYSTVNLFFLALMIKLSPFAYLPFAPPEGMGLNPLLQDPWMVIHPPIMFLGYAMAAVPFAIAMAALILNDYTDWVKRAFPWVAITALMLAAGNILGGYWAYKTLGWGGYWAWDPVENSSLIPWLMSLALIHGMILEKRSGAMRKINLLLSSLTFLLVVYGTFLTRSGVLADFSVHSFVDLGINQYLVMFMLLYLTITVVLFAWRAKGIGHHPVDYNFFGKEFFLFGGMVMLFLMGFVVLFWSSLPLLTQLVGAEPRAADISTYNNFAGPLTVLFALLLALSPLSGFKPITPEGWRRVARIALAVAVIIPASMWLLLPRADMVFAIVFAIILLAIGITFARTATLGKMIVTVVLFIVGVGISISVGVQNYLYLLLVGMAVASIGSNVTMIVHYLPGQWRVAGGHLTHFGFGIMVIGILASSAFTTSEQIVLTEGTKETTYGLTIEYKGMQNDINHPMNELILSIDEDGVVEEGRPQLYYSQRLDGIMKRPYVRKSLMYDLYFSPQQVREAEANSGLYIAQGASSEVGDYRFGFVGYQMGDHEVDATGMQVIAIVTAEIDGQVDTLMPMISYEEADDGHSHSVSHPVEFGAENQYQMAISQVLPDQHAVLLDIPGLTEATGGSLLLDVSKKPIINLVWIGTTLIMLGAAFVYFRRKREL